MATISSLSIGIGVDSAKLKAGLTDAEKKTKQWSDRTKKHAASAGKAFSGIAGALAGIVAAVSIKALADNADVMIKNAQGANIAFAAFQKLEFGLQQSGLSAGSLQKAMVKVNKTINDAGAGSKGAVEDLAAIGLTFDDLNKMNPEQRFRAIVDGLNGMNDAGQRSAIAMTLLGKEFASRNLSTEGLDAASAGLITISDSAAGAAEGFGDAFNLMQTNIQNLMTNALGPFYSVATTAMNALSQFAVDNPVVTNIILGLTGVGVAIAGIAASVTLMGGPVVIIMGAIAAAIAGIVLVTNNWDTILKTVTEYLAGVFGTDVQTITGYMESFAGWVSTVAEFLKFRLLAGLELVKSAISTSLVFWQNLAGAVVELFTLDFAGFGERMKAAFKAVGEFFSDNFGGIITHLVDNIREQFGWAFQKVSDVFSNAIQGSINWVMTKLYEGLNKMAALANMLPGVDIAEQTYTGSAPQNTAGERPGWVPYAWNGMADMGTGPGSRNGPRNNAPVVVPPSGFVPPSGGSGGGGGGGKSEAEKEAERLRKEAEKEEEKRAKDALKAAQDFSDNILGGMASAFAQGIKTGDWKEALHGWLDQITTQIIDNFSKNLMDAIFGDVFKDIFSNFGKQVETGMTEALSGAGGGSGGGGWLKGIFGKGGFFSGLFGGGGGGGGGLGGLLGGLGGILGMANGGIVPHTPYSKIGQDSVPTMLMPGELVVPVGEVANFQNGGNGGVYNINITGDISRQTKTEIYKMLPDLAKSINEQNLEAGFK